MPDQEKSFAELGFPVVLVHSLRRAGIEQPFPVQSAAIPDIMAGRDVLGRAPTGSGKTLAFGLPVLARLAGKPSARARPRALILAPTRELALQIESVLDEHASVFGLRTVGVVGGVPLKRQIDRITRGVDILVATPGRLVDLVEQRALELNDVEITVVDEADRMSDMGFLPQVDKILNWTPQGGQRLLFSATLDGDVDALVHSHLRSPATHSVEAAESTSVEVQHYFLRVADDQKSAVALSIAARDGRTIMFVRTKHAVDRLADDLRAHGVNAAALHGDKSQHNRTRTLAAFSDGSVPVLVATDVAARGLHVDGLSLVVHVDPPLDGKDYLHRAGRTARAGESGTVVTLATARQVEDVIEAARSAGIIGTSVEVSPGDSELNRITGARTPTGRPLASPAASVAAATDSRRRARRPSDGQRNEGRARRSGRR